MKEDREQFYDDFPEEDRRHSTRVPNAWMRHVDRRLDRLETRVNYIFTAIAILIFIANLATPFLAKLIGP